VKASARFSDPEWDGEPAEPDVCVECGQFPCECPDPEPEPCDVCGEDPCVCPHSSQAASGQTPCACESKPSERVKVKLADGKEREIQHMMATTFWHPDGTPMSAQQFLEALFGKLPEFFQSEDELRARWSAPDTRAKLLDGLAEKGFGGEQLAEMQTLISAEQSDLFDVLAYVAYTRVPVTREERATLARPSIEAHFSAKQRAFLDFVLGQYVKVGVEELSPDKLSPLLKLRYNNAIADAIADLGAPSQIGHIFASFQQYLYAQPCA
jgi:type I restriction enzyme R subunit